LYDWCWPLHAKTTHKVQASPDCGDEIPYRQGTVAGTSCYRYNVEWLTDGQHICPTQPTYLKEGFDFRISVEGVTHSQRERQ